MLFWHFIAFKKRCILFYQKAFDKGAFKIVGGWLRHQPRQAAVVGVSTMAVNLISMYGSKRLLEFIRSFHFEISPPQPVGLRNWNASTFASFEKICCAFFRIPTASVPNQKRKLIQLLF